MHEALLLAEAAMGRTSPNPAVGAVIVRDGAIIGRGAHRQVGEGHAEVNALLDAGDARGATCYSTLEPCSHIGLQPACCNALTEAGVTRVCFGCEDADLRSGGQAARLLGSQGIEVKAGVLREPCESFLDYYLLSKRRDRCFVHLKLAMSLDGKLACANGSSQWLSSGPSLGLAHYLRWKSDAILVGYRTVLHDNPRLNVRPEQLSQYYAPRGSERFRSPTRVVLDPRFELLPRLSGGSGLNIAELSGMRADMPRLIIAGAEALLPDDTSQPDGIEVLGLVADGGALSLLDLCRKLNRRGIRSLMVEGGAGVARSFLAQRLCDKLTAVVTPVLIGADGLGFSPAYAADTVSQCPHMHGVDIELLEPDVALSGYLESAA
jgi:diaminohydroxyphosphoribosylaminopyrimidine deaminase/5-amino-6-(5-phosphoribosylamino)uracil reductase